MIRKALLIFCVVGSISVALSNPFHPHFCSVKVNDGATVYMCLSDDVLRAGWFSSTTAIKVEFEPDDQYRLLQVKATNGNPSKHDADLINPESLRDRGMSIHAI